MFLVAVVIFAVIAGFIRKGNLGNVVKADIKVPYLFFLSLILFVAIEAGNAAGWSIVVEYSLWMRFVAYLVLISSIFFNIQTLDFWPISLLFGTVANFVAIFANVGRMPVSEKALSIAGIDVAVVEGSNYLELIGQSTSFPFLGGNIPIPLPGIFAQVISIGTVFIAIGAFGYIQELMLGKIVDMDDIDDTDDIKEVIEEVKEAIGEIKEEIKEEIAEITGDKDDDDIKDLYDEDIRQAILGTVAENEADIDDEDDDDDDYDDYDDYFDYDEDDDDDFMEEIEESTYEMSSGTQEEIVVIAEDVSDAISEEVIEEIIDSELEDDLEEIHDEELVAEIEEITEDIIEEIAEDEEEAEIEAEAEAEEVSEITEEAPAEEVLEEVTEESPEDVPEITDEPEEIIDGQTESDAYDITFDDEDDLTIDGLDDYEDSYSFIDSDEEITDEAGAGDEIAEEIPSGEVTEETIIEETAEEDILDEEEFDPELEAIFDAIRSSVADNSAAVEREMGDDESFGMDMVVEYTTADSFFDGLEDDEDDLITIDDIESGEPEEEFSLDNFVEELSETPEEITPEVFDVIDDEVSDVIIEEPVEEIIEEIIREEVPEDVTDEIIEDAVDNDVAEDLGEEITVEEAFYDEFDDYIDEEFIGDADKIIDAIDEAEPVEELTEDDITEVIESVEDTSDAITEAIEETSEEIANTGSFADIIESIISSDDDMYDVDEPISEEDIIDEDIDDIIDIISDDEPVGEVSEHEVIADIIRQEENAVDEAVMEVIAETESADEEQSDSQYIIVDGKIVENPNYKLRRSSKNRFSDIDEALLTEASSRRRRRSSGSRKSSFEIKDDEE